MAFASLVVKISGDISSLDAATKKAVERVKTLGANLQSVGSSLALGISAPLAGIAGVALKSAGDLEALKLGLISVAGGAKQAEQQFRQLREVAKLPGLGLQEAVQGSINLQALGFSAEKSKNLLLQFGNALATVGRGREDLNEVIRQLGQLGARGKVTADNLKPIIERVPQVAGIVKKEFGTIDTEQLQKLGVSSAEFIAILERELGKLPRVTGGLKNDFENLQDSITIAFGEAGSALAPFAKAFIDGFAIPALEKLKYLAEGFKGLSSPTQTFLVTLGGIVTTAPLAIAALGSIISNAALLGETFVKLGGAAGLLSKALVALPWVAIAAEVLYIADAWFSYDQASRAAIGSQKDLEKSIDKTIAALRKQGIAVDESKRFGDVTALDYTRRGLDGKYKEFTTKGTESTKEFIAELNKLAIAHGRTVKPAADNRGAHDDFARKLAESAAAAKKAERDFDALTKALQKQAEAQNLIATKALDAFRPEPAEVYSRKVALIKAELDAAADEMARFQLNGLNAFDFPKLDEARVSIKDLGKDVDSLQRVFKDADFTLSAGQVNLGAQLKLPRSIEDLKRQAETSQKEYEKTLENAGKAAARSQKQLSQQVSLVVNDLARNIENLITKGGKLKDVFVSAFGEIGKALIRSALEKQFVRIAGLIQDLIAKHLPKLSKALSDIFGSGTSAASGAAQAAGGAASAAGSVGSAAGSAGGAVGSAVGGSLTGVVSAVSGVVTAVSGVISNFQLAGVNKSLDLIVKHTLETASQLIGGIQPQINTYLPYLKSIHERMVQIISSGIPVFGAGAAAGGGGVTYNFYFEGATFTGDTTQDSVTAMFREAARLAAVQA